MSNVKSNIIKYKCKLVILFLWGLEGWTDAERHERKQWRRGVCPWRVSQAEIFPIAMRVTVTCYQIIISHCRFMPVTHTKGWDSDKWVCVPLIWLLSVPDHILSLIFDFLHTFFFFYRSHSCSQSCWLLPLILFSFSRPPGSTKNFTFALHLNLHTFSCQSAQIAYCHI